MARTILAATMARTIPAAGTTVRIIPAAATKAEDPVLLTTQTSRPDLPPAVAAVVPVPVAAAVPSPYRQGGFRRNRR
jgi:hypothetical protein